MKLNRSELNVCLLNNYPAGTGQTHCFGAAVYRIFARSFLLVGLGIATLVIPCQAVYGQTPQGPSPVTTIGDAGATEASGAAAQASAELRSIGDVAEVTLYRNQALVTREIPLSLAKDGLLRITDLPEAVDPDSLFAEGGEGITVQALRVSPRVVDEADQESIRNKRREIEAIELEIRRVESELAVNKWDLEKLNRMVELSADLGRTDLSRGTLNAESLIRLTDFAMEKRAALNARLLASKNELDDLKKRIELLNKELALISGKQQSTRYDALVFLRLDPAKLQSDSVVRVSYQVGNCGWQPHYTLHGESGRSDVRLRYSAMVEQLTGEQWDNVLLRLSTASPNTFAARPMLKPLNVAPADPDELAELLDLDDPFSDDGEFNTAEGLAELLNRFHDERAMVQSTLAPGTTSQSARDLALNSLAGQLQEVELQANANSWRSIAPDVQDDLSSQIYQLAERVSLDSRREQQWVQILETDLRGDMYLVATPLLSSYAFREAQVINSEDNGLLSGPADVYLDGRFVGRMELPSVASGQKMTIGFGADQQVRTRRELVEKTDQVKGGNRQLRFRYRLVLSNFKDEPVQVRLYDRIPTSNQSQQLSVTLEEPEFPLSVDGMYQRMERPTGILRWDLEVPAGRHGSDAFDVHYGYMMEFDRSRIPSMLDAVAELQSQFDEQAWGSSGGMGGGGFGGGGAGFGGGGVFCIPPFLDH